jgi:high affinity Mn2+ porin
MDSSLPLPVRIPWFVPLAGAVLGGIGSEAAAGGGAIGASPNVLAEGFAVHGQFTFVEQATSDFTAPYRGTNSLSPRIGRETVDATLYLGARLWTGSELWINPEVDQGFGLDNTVGVAGFPSGEAYKVGRKTPYLRLPRLFVRQTIGLGGSQEAIEPGANQLGGSQSADRLVFTLGKFSAVDIFDTNPTRTTRGPTF